MWRLVVVVALVTGCSESGSSNNEGCAGLSLLDCRNTAGCKPDLCDGCICDIAYRGCIAESTQPEACPLLGCPSGICCRDQQQCDGGQGVCTQPGTPMGCGACNATPGTCTSDATCKAQGATMICEPIPCSCDGQLACVEGCTNDDTCPEGTRCNLATARCESTQCLLDEDCPGAFVCPAGTCVRPSCTSDLDCDGFCVLGACFTRSLGECRPPVP